MESPLFYRAYGLDKSKAIQHKRRISEKALLLQTLISVVLVHF